MSTIVASPIQCSIKEPNPAQKRFNTLSKGLQRDKALLKKWEQTHSKLKIEFAENIVPLFQEIDEMKLKVLVLLDHSYSNKALTPRQKEKLQNFIQQLAEACLSFDESDIAEEIYDRYSDKTVSEMDEEIQTALKSGLEDMFGINLGEEFDFESEEAFAEFKDAVNKKSEQEETTHHKKKSKRKSSPKAKKKSDKEIIESQSIKEVFRQLTKVLHPDREMDENKREEKSKLMQQANIAYKKNDLLALLELQFEIEQFEQKALDNLATDKLLAYNRMLQRQRKQIKEEITLIKQRISYELDIPYFYNKPEDTFSYIVREKYKLTEIKSQLVEDYESFSDIKSLKKWLNAMKKSQFQRNEPDMFDLIMSDLFDE